MVKHNDKYMAHKDEETNITPTLHLETRHGGEKKHTISCKTSTTTFLKVLCRISSNIVKGVLRKEEKQRLPLE